MNRKGFTLVEILVVTVLIAVLTALALPMLVKTLEKAKMDEAVSNLNFIRAAQERYSLSYNTFSSDIDSLNIEDPNDSSARYFNYTIVSADDDDFIARAQRVPGAPASYGDYLYDISKDGEITSPNNSPLI
ncbi:MAG: type II secretion system protein [Candidatus Omnitrophota bacterium]